MKKSTFFALMLAVTLSAICWPVAAQVKVWQCEHSPQRRSSRSREPCGDRRFLWIMVLRHRNAQPGRGKHAAGKATVDAGSFVAGYKYVPSPCPIGAGFDGRLISLVISNDRATRHGVLKSLPALPQSELSLPRVLCADHFDS